MAITKSGTRVTLTAEAGVADSWTTAYDMDDILAASDAGGWGMSRVFDTYFIPFSIYVESETYFTCYLISSCIKIEFTGAVRDDVYSYYSSTTSHTRIGRDLDYNDQYAVHWSNNPEVPSGNRRTYFGGDAMIANMALNLSHYTYLYGSAGYQAVMKNSYLNDLNFAIVANNYAEMYNVQRNEGTYGFWTGGDTTVYDDCLIVNANIGVLASNPVMRFKGLRIYNTQSYDTYLRAFAGDKVLDLVDCEVTKSKLYFYNSGTNNDCIAEHFLWTTTTVYVKDENGDPMENADVTITAPDDTVLLTAQTNAQGMIDPVEVKYYYKARRANPDTSYDDIIVDYEPMKVTVSKAGYLDGTLSDVYVNAGQETILRVDMDQPVYVQSPIEGGISDSELSGTISVSALEGSISASTITGTIEEDIS